MFVINDEGGSGNNSFFMRKAFKKSVKWRRNESRREQVATLAVREHGTEHWSRLVRFYTLFHLSFVVQ